MPLDNIWVLENEFNHNEFSEPLINNQKGAFTAVCCYNYYEDTQPTYGNDPRVISGKLRRIYNSGQKEFLFRLDSIALNSFIAPILLCQNPNQPPVTNAFEIDFQDILKRVTTFI